MIHGRLELEFYIWVVFLVSGLVMMYVYRDLDILINLLSQMVVSVFRYYEIIFAMIKNLCSWVSDINIEQTTRRNVRNKIQVQHQIFLVKNHTLFEIFLKPPPSHWNSGSAPGRKKRGKIEHCNFIFQSICRDLYEQKKRENYVDSTNHIFLRSN